MAQRSKLTLGYSPYDSYGTSIEPFDKVFSNKQDVKKEGFKNIDCLVLWGGTDIHPSYYKQKRHPWSGASEFPSERDVFEWKAVLYCKAKNIPIIGVCRGAQLLCAAAGGSLVQHMQGHGHDHNITTSTGQTVKTTSVHHQMMIPFKVPHTMIAWSEQPRCSSYEGENGQPIHEMFQRPEPEIVYFPEIRGLAIQGHPEYGNATKDFVNLCNQLVVDYLLPPF